MHNISQYSEARIAARLDDLIEFGAERWYQTEHMCQCDDFEVDDGVTTRQCPWNDPAALEAELTRRDMEVAR